MWADVGQQLAGILNKQVFGCLLGTPSYTALLRSGGLAPPFTQYLKYSPPPFPPAYEGACQVYGRLITSQVSRMDALFEDDSLKAEVVSGPVSLFRAMHSRQKGPEPPDLRRGTAYIGDWWFDKELLDACLLFCQSRSQQAGATADPSVGPCLLTELRRRLAIRMDWNAVAALRRLVLDANESIPVITGIGTPQRMYSINADWRKFPAKSRPESQQQLPGGARQVWIPWTPQKSMQLWTPKGGFAPKK